ncbi:hypothetical protein P872_00610 [Rhodonellum psychrophilum GCM71 = DSM 17998]|uniref:Uncharacterized protein n=2 Tax=Rhodonellum TaxID=336827 RepID=U5C761_9BACT|nr:hypothetical protein P872_00610 [Rhodonellum psychrophilum GCM71 = DSM 17998]SDY40301.1 hypothetical protein SAMN05444412_10144 [Rhodonellum ikkaensis]
MEIYSINISGYIGLAIQILNLILLSLIAYGIFRLWKVIVKKAK